MKIFEKKFPKPNFCSFYLNNSSLFKTVLWAISYRLGEKKYIYVNDLNFNIKKKYIYISIVNVFFKSFFKTICSIFKNNLFGFSRGFKHYLVVRGLGFRVTSYNSGFIFLLGFSHSIYYKPPIGFNVSVLPRKSRVIILSTCDLQKIKEVSNKIKKFRNKSKYKIQGIFSYKEKIFLKDNKKNLKKK